jgi:hypothetical protein
MFSQHLLIKQETTFEFLHYVVVTCSDILEEHTASIFRVTEPVQVVVTYDGLRVFSQSQLQ